jgi:hypothetical protein
MNWARIRPLLGSFPGGGEPPVFEINSDENGSAVVEFAWDPAALLSPASYPEALRYYNTSSEFNATITKDNGSTMVLTVPAQQIQLNGGRATWIMPKNLWDAYVEETLKSLSSPPKTTFVRSIYYRVRITAPGSSQAALYPNDVAIQRFSSVHPSLHSRISILPISGNVTDQAVPDNAALQAMGGISPLFPNLWSNLLLTFWKTLPDTDPYRRSLVAIFAHPNYQSISDVNLRAKLLKLWLFAGATARKRLPQLLDRQAVIGSNITTTVLLKQDLRGGKTLIDNLLALLQIVLHLDFATLISTEQLLDNVITEILDPNGQLNQGEAGTCSPTSIQTFLTIVNPSEYVRLQLGLLSSAGSTQLANGANVSIPPGIYQLMRYPNGSSPFYARTYAELGFQSAILKYAKSSFPAYDPAAPVNAPNGINTVFQATIAGGLLADETKRALDSIFNVNFTTHYIPLTSQADNQSAQINIHRDFLQALSTRQQQILFATFWSQPYQFGHVILGVRREQGRVFFKNPQYAGSRPPAGATAGTTVNNPSRRYEDPTAALESISEADLLTWIKGYWVPDTAIL